MPMPPPMPMPMPMVPRCPPTTSGLVLRPGHPIPPVHKGAGHFLLRLGQIGGLFGEVCLDGSIRQELLLVAPEADLLRHLVAFLEKIPKG